MSKKTNGTEQKSCRRVQLVINNPAETYNHAKIKELLQTFKSLLYWCMCDEIGQETQTYHTHLYLKFSNVVRFSTLKKKFPTAHIEECFSTSSKNRAYIRKEGDEYKDKKETNLIDTFEEGGIFTEEQQGRRNDYETILNDICSGKSTAEILLGNPASLPLLQYIDRARTTILEEKYSMVMRTDLKVIYVQGETGTGKSRTILDEHGTENVCRITNYQKNPFDSYCNSQSVIVFEEFRDSIPIADMLNYLDIYPISLPARYTNRVACYHTVYIVSNWKFEDQYHSIQNTDPETYKAFLRRIHTVRVYKAPNIYNDFSLGEYFITENFEDVDARELPFI